MSFFRSLIQIIKSTLTRHPLRVLFTYSLVSELLILMYLFLAFLWTAEILLPGFISLRINLTWYLMSLLGASTTLALFGKAFDITPLNGKGIEKFALVVGSLWGISIVSLSLYGFPWWTALILVFFLAWVATIGFKTLFRAS